VLAQTLTFSPECDDNFFQEIHACTAVFLLRGHGEPYISKTANLRRRLQRLLGRPTELSRRLNLRERVDEIEFTLTGSDFETQLLLYKILRQVFPKTYAARLRLRPAPLVKLHLENAYPRASVTTRFAAHSSSNLCYGPFPSRAAAEKFSSDALDFFKMRRCVDDLHPDPAFPGCVYSEMKMCLAPCFKGCTDAEYQTEVGRVQAFFASGGESLARELAEQREKASAELAFEEAAAVHTKIEKLKPVRAQLAEIVRRIDRLDAIIVQPGADRDSVCLFRFRKLQFAGPVLFRIERHGVSQTEPGKSGIVKPQTMESRVEETIGALAENGGASSAVREEQLAILKRWYYRSHRVGEIFFADEKDSWPLRRIVRGIGRVYRGEKHEEPASFSATESNVQPS
jgi:excinuclease ABC subunit C